MFSYMDDALHRFQTFNNAFFLGWASNKVKAKANDLRTELVKNWKVDEQTHADT